MTADKWFFQIRKQKFCCTITFCKTAKASHICIYCNTRLKANFETGEAMLPRDILINFLEAIRISSKMCNWCVFWGNCCFLYPDLFFFMSTCLVQWGLLLVDLDDSVGWRWYFPLSWWLCSKVASPAMGPWAAEALTPWKAPAVSKDVVSNTVAVISVNNFSTKKPEFQLQI